MSTESSNTSTIAELHDLISQRFDRIEAKLQRGAETFVFFDDALKRYRERYLDDQLQFRSAPQQLLAKFATDPELSFPHRKILEYLLRQFDYQAQDFRDVHVSKLVKDAHVGKGRAAVYLRLLERKGYIRKRSDGYRVYYRIKAI